jgi:hypothetical protein
VNDLAMRVYDQCSSVVTSVSRWYSQSNPSAALDQDDLEQQVWCSFFSWLPAHRGKIEELLDRPPGEISRWMSRFARARICDLLDWQCAAIRDARITVHASGVPGEGLGFLDMLAAPASRAMELDTNATMARVAEFLITPPESVIAAYRQRHTSVSSGRVSLADGENTAILEGFQIGAINFSTGISEGTLDTSFGMAYSQKAGEGWVIKFAHAPLVLSLSSQGQGSWTYSVVTPRLGVIDPDLVAEHLGISPSLVVRAWREIRKKVLEFLG